MLFKFRNLLFGILLLLLPISATAQVSKSTITAQINSSTAGSLPGGNILRNITNSYVDWLTCTGSGGIIFWNAGVPTCLPIGLPGQLLTVVSGLPAWVSSAIPPLPLAVTAGGTGDTGTAWTPYTPTISCGTGTITTDTISGRYKMIGKTVWFSVNLVLTTNGSCAGNWNISVPPGVVANANTAVTGEDFNAATTLNGGVNSMGASMFVVKYDGTYAGVSGHIYSLSGTIEQQ